MAVPVVSKSGLAAEALQSLVKRCSEDPKLANDTNIHIVINTEKPIGIKNDYVPRIIPLTSCKMHKPSDLRILLITKDPSTLYRKTLTKDPSTADLFKTILSVRNLKGKYRGSRLSKLFREYDLVVADYRVHHLLPQILGSAFFHSNKKLPFMVKMSQAVKAKREKLPEECDAAYVRAQLRSICKNTFYVPNVDNCLSVKIGEVGVHTVDEMVHNIDDIVRFLTDKSKKPQGGVIRGDISAIFVKTSNSVSLPIYKAEKKSEVHEEEELRL
ncbi:Utp30p [Lachancea thermotolerans CBS 6340]|uniref:KLTH0F05588p n=1 Tax=Lachancea thermotolerans (strain ATCC 56472 / CBS 6340 / NRRL Y-8284) TaxID=559295 RepID=C5DKL0_LACTC|nr:KLTH0F05588p [Lachancea thermotolerans CBS 6340]CAR24011.1 KLTH0F05588p [Lachancea thermotolerans CBS 6340]